MLHLMSRFLQLIFFLFFSNLIYAQSPALSSHLTVEDGLPSNEVYDIYQDSDGYLWFASDRGLVRYDGKDFTSISKNLLPEQIIFNFFEQPNGDVWITTESGRLYYFRGGREPSFIPFKYNHLIEKQGYNGVVLTLCVISNEEIYCSMSSSCGYLHIRKGIVVQSPISKADYKSKNSPEAIALFKEKGTQMISFDGGEYHFGFRGFPQHEFKSYLSPFKETHISQSCSRNHYRKSIRLENGARVYFAGNDFIELQRLDGSVKKINTENFPISIGKHGKGFWIGIRKDGVMLFDENGMLTHHFLKGKTVSALELDHTGGIWVSTLEDGIFQYRNLQVVSLKIVNDNGPVISFASYDQELFCTQNANEIYQLYPNHCLLRKYNNEAMFTSHYLIEHPNSNEILELSLIGDKGLIYDGSTWKEYYNGVGSHFVQKNGSDYFLSSTTILTYDPNGFYQEFYHSNRIYDMVLHRDEVFVAAKDGLLTFNGSSFKKVGANWSNQPLRCLVPFNGKLIIGTELSGLIVYDGKTTKSIKEKDGLAGNFVTCIRVIDQNSILVGTHKGLSRVVFNGREVEIYSMTTEEGLLDNNITAIYPFRKNYWVGTPKGISIVPEELMEGEKRVIDFFLEIQEIRVNDESVDRPKMKLNLSHWENRIEFWFHGISFASKGLTYRFKLKGVDKNWRYTKENKATYPYLLPGTYEFIVQCSENNQWKEEVHVSVTIAKPYWKTWWFIVLMVLAAGWLAYFVFWIRILSYNRDVVREILLGLTRIVRSKEQYLVIEEGTKSIKIPTKQIQLVKSSRNYIEICTDKERHVVRSKISDFLKMVPDPLEYIRVNRSYIVRIDKISVKGKSELKIGKHKIPVGVTYQKEIEKIFFN